MKSLYCVECGEYLMAGSGSLIDCSCGWKQPEDKGIDVAEYEALQAECEKLRKEAERYNLLASMIVAESTGAVMTPQQEALFGALNTITHLRTADEVHAMFDTAIQEYNPCQT